MAGMFLGAAALAMAPDSVQKKANEVASSVRNAVVDYFDLYSEYRKKNQEKS